MHVTSFSSSLIDPTNCKAPRLARRTAAIATVIGASGLSATGSDSAVEHPRLLARRRTAAICDFHSRLHLRTARAADAAPRQFPSTNLLLASSCFGFLADVTTTMRNRDSMLAPVLMRNAPAAVACFAINALAWGALAHRSCYEANENRTLAVFAASYATQTAARCVLSLAPMAAPWRMVSGSVFGLLGAKLVYDICHRRLSVLHQSWTECTGDVVESQGNGRPDVLATESGSFSDRLNYAECASHIACAAAACVMPTHPWCKAAALCGGALTAYLLGPHWVLCRSICRVRLADRESGHNYMDYIHVSDFVEDRSVVPWFAFPSDPMVAEDKPLVPGEIATGANYFADLAASNSQCARRSN